MNKLALILVILCGCSTPAPQDAKRISTAPVIREMQEFRTDSGIEIFTENENVLLRFMHPETEEDRSKDPVFFEWSNDLVTWNLDYYLLYPGTVFLDREVMKTNAFMFYRIRGLRSDY